MTHLFRLVVVLAFSLMVAACGSTPEGGTKSTEPASTPAEPTPTTSFHGDPDTEAGFPSSESWAAGNPQPSDGVQLDLAINPFVGQDFESEPLEVRLDGELIVSGTVLPQDPDAHLCPIGPYSVVLEPGSHQIEALTGSGESVSETFDLTELSMGNILYRHPSSGTSDPEISWELYDGQGYVCE